MTVTHLVLEVRHSNLDLRKNLEYGIIHQNNKFMKLLKINAYYSDIHNISKV